MPSPARRSHRHGQRLPGATRRGVMSPIYRSLGLTIGVIVHDLSYVERRAAYGADITYGTNNEFGFDYLRDNMKNDLRGMCAARTSIRDRRRSGLHPDRRSRMPPNIPALPNSRPISMTASTRSFPNSFRTSTTLSTKTYGRPLTEEGVSKMEKLGLGNMYDPITWKRSITSIRDFALTRLSP